MTAPIYYLIKDLAKNFNLTYEIMIEKLFTLNLCDINGKIKKSGYTVKTLSSSENEPNIYFSHEVIPYIEKKLENDLEFNIAKIIQNLQKIHTIAKEQKLNKLEENKNILPFMHMNNCSIVFHNVESNIHKFRVYSAVETIYENNKHNNQFLLKLYELTQKEKLFYLFEYFNFFKDLLKIENMQNLSDILNKQKIITMDSATIKI